VIAHAVVRIPVPFNDNFSEIANSYRIPLTGLLRNEFLDPGPYFRPFEIVWRWLISHGLQQGIFGYSLFETIWLVLVVVSFALVCHPRSAREFTAFLVALAVLVGHHAMQGAWEFNIFFSNGIALLAGILSIALIGNAPTFWGQIAAILLTVVCLLTKEVGLVVAWVFVVAHLLRMPGIRRPTAVIIVAIVAVYVCFHFYTLPPLKEHDPQRATTLAGFASNFVATLIMFWIGLPWDGLWKNSTRFIQEPWQWVQIVAGIATLLLLICGWILGSKGARSQTNMVAHGVDRRWFILLGAALLACAALGFYYTRHRHGAPAVPLLAYCVYLSLSELLSRLDSIQEQRVVASSRVLTWMTIAGLACALLWPVRVVTGLEFLRSLGARSLANWHNKMPEYWHKADEDYRPFLLPFSESVDMVPWPRRDVWIFRFLGQRPHKSVDI
jgi:hypothetical protein